GPGCGAGAADADAGTHVAVDNDAIVRTWGETPHGTDFSVNTCHTDTGVMKQLTGHESDLGLAGVTADGNTVAARADDGTIQLLDARTSSFQGVGGPVRAPLVNHLDLLEAAAVVFSPDGQHMAAIEQSGD